MIDRSQLEEIIFFAKSATCWIEVNSNSDLLKVIKICEKFDIALDIEATSNQIIFDSCFNIKELINLIIKKGIQFIFKVEGDIQHPPILITYNRQSGLNWKYYMIINGKKEEMVKLSDVMSAANQFNGSSF